VSCAGKGATRVFAPEHDPEKWKPVFMLKQRDQIMIRFNLSGSWPGRPRVSIYFLEKQFRKRMDCRAKPGNDAVIGAALRSCRRKNAGFHTWRDTRSKLKSPD
jgi:hypothetical protein